MAMQNRQKIAFSLATAVLGASAACGPKLDPATARAQFSSKALSRPGVIASQQASAPAPERTAEAPATETAVSEQNATEAKPEATTASKLTTTELTATERAATEARPSTTIAASAPATAPDAAPMPAPAPAPAPAGRDAERVLRASAASEYAALRAHAIEAAIGNPRLLAELAPRALRDENRGVRFVACMAIAESNASGLSDAIAPLLADQSASVRAAAMLALARSGEKVNYSPLAAMLEDNDPEIRANAYLVLGELGNQSAIPMIRESIGRGMKRVNPLRVRLVDLAAAEALVKLGDETEVEPIRAALFAPPEQGELTVVACDAVRRLRDEVARPMLERLISAGGTSVRSPEIRLAAARALAALGQSPIPMTVASQFVEHPDARIRAQVASLLGEIRTPEAMGLLANLLDDRNPVVQVAAAGGLESQP
ncbi:MAG: hypothetical protein RL325_1043 [Planctomycetota bacterium]|jgi:HEAT repeat protein